MFIGPLYAGWLAAATIHDNPARRARSARDGVALAAAGKSSQVHANSNPTQGKRDEDQP
jgi:hypothetical protein